MERQPLVCVTMPVYNGARTIQMAINSLLYQTYSNWKCIIVNDCSTDSTANILEKHYTDFRFKIIHLNKNKGRGNARQVALDNAEGDFITFLDADDFYHPRKLEIQVKTFIDNTKIVACSSGVGSFDANKQLLNYRGIKYFGYHKNYQRYYFQGFPASIMIKLEIAKMHKYDIRLNVGEDNNFIRKCLFQKDYYILSDILYFYEELGTISKRKIINYQLDSIKTILLTFNGFSKIYFFLIALTKLLLKVIYVNVHSVDKLILKRGVPVTKNQIEEFKEVLSQLNYNHELKE